MTERDDVINKNVLAITLLAACFLGCYTNNAQDEQINYQELAPLNVELVKEITGDDSYLPGVLRNLLILSDSTMLVSDTGTNSIEQFTTEGEHVATVAEAGRGPGELSNLFSMYQGAGDTLFVRNRINTERIDAFTRGPDGIYQYQHSWAPDEAKDRYITILGAGSQSKYYATASWNAQDLQKARMDFKKAYKQVPVVIVNQHEKIFRDSLYLLKTPNPLAEFGPGSMRVIGMPPHQTADQFKLLEDGNYVIARPDSAALYFYDTNHELQHRVSVNVTERQITDEDLEFLLDKKNLEGDDRKKIKARVPDAKPPFLNAWVTDYYIWLHTDSEEKGKQLVVLSSNGEPLGKVELAFEDEIKVVKDNRIYTLHTNPKTGHRIRIYHVEI